MAATIIEPGYVEASAGNAPYWRKPDTGSLFSDRAQRFKSLAADHRLADFLLFMADLSQAQHRVLCEQDPVALPAPEQLDLCKAHDMPPLNHQSHSRSPEWRAGLHRLMTHIAEKANSATLSSIARIKAMPDRDLEKLADRILAGEYADQDLAAAPLIGAALQVYWARMAAALDTNAVTRSEVQNLCPACGAAPSVSLVRIGGAEQGLRYLHCSLCAGEWNMVRIKCSHCLSTEGIAYLGIDGDEGAIKAETCDRCHSYLKILYLEHNPSLDPMSDDLASLTLDILVDEAGYQRSGSNLLLFPGIAGA